MIRGHSPQKGIGLGFGVGLEAKGWMKPQHLSRGARGHRNAMEGFRVLGFAELQQGGVDGGTAAKGTSLKGLQGNNNDKG